MTEPFRLEASDSDLSRVTITRDGSLSLSDHTEHAGQTGEAMHSSQGALSESIYVYGPAIESALDLAFKHDASGQLVRIVVVGMGLAYLELLILAKLLVRLSSAQPPDFKFTGSNLAIVSFESNPVHRQRLESWINGDHETLLEAVSRAILNDSWVSQEQTFLDSEALRLAAKTMIKLNNWTIAEALDCQIAAKLIDCHAILFDPYSPRSCPELWTEDFLSILLDAAPAAKQCVFATYASRTDLHRALRKSGFHVTKRKGFGGKRECTYAVYGIDDAEKVDHLRPSH